MYVRRLSKAVHVVPAVLAGLAMSQQSPIRRIDMKPTEIIVTIIIGAVFAWTLAEWSIM